MFGNTRGWTRKDHLAFILCVLGGACAISAAITAALSDRSAMWWFGIAAVVLWALAFVTLRKPTSTPRHSIDHRHPEGAKPAMTAYLSQASRPISPMEQRSFRLMNVLFGIAGLVCVVLTILPPDIGNRGNPRIGFAFLAVIFLLASYMGRFILRDEHRQPTSTPTTAT